MSTYDYRLFYFLNMLLIDIGEEKIFPAFSRNANLRNLSFKIIIITAIIYIFIHYVKWHRLAKFLNCSVMSDFQNKWIKIAKETAIFVIFICLLSNVIRIILQSDSDSASKIKKWLQFPKTQNSCKPGVINEFCSRAFILPC